MKLRLCALGPSLSFDEAKALRPNFRSEAGLPEKTSAVELAGAVPLANCDTTFLFDYDIFPTYLLRAQPQWRAEGRPMRVGDVIVQRALLPPIGFGLCAEFAVRISAIFDQPARVGFAYETLAGHLERGTSEFYFEQRGDRVFFIIHTRSEPGHWLSRLGGGLLTRTYQAWCTSQALKHVARRFHAANAGI